MAYFYDLLMHEPTFSVDEGLMYLLTDHVLLKI